MIARSVLFRRLRDALPALAGAGLLLYAVTPWLPGAREARPPRTIVLYGFSILGEAVDRGVFPEFQKAWLDRTHQHVELVSSYAGSGTVTNQILLGVPAQVAILSLELDATKIGRAHV